MPHPRRTDGLPALLTLCALAAATVLIATLGVAPAQISGRALLGAMREPGESAFIAGHRGGAQDAPENTLPAVRAALDAGYDYVEVDLQLTADRHIVLMHDATVDRTTDGRGRVSALTLAEVRELDAGSSFSARFAGTAVPTADEFLAVLAAHHGRAILDLKGLWDSEAAAALVAAVEAHGLQDRVVVASFDARTLADIAARSAVIARLAILKRLPADVVAAARQAGVRGVVVDRKALQAQPDLVDRLHAEDLRVVVYTLNSDEQWGAATELGVDGIVTDDPRMLAGWQRAAADG
ncbi:glycerophosphodiester phosphodiesterase [Microbacterium telephonicum]|uniref:Glycerophosphoryl diester phosphodiesterase n=1 Tax=Microbacterium telephonicum TaxID=1714841 RepID=A0A498C2V9_9MICO|nr:glycerophosphodiester phosphodiesterase family protein [Microbacterium telephonicum]RLK47530.1 glycerophosphoryl diester phosphodiesterase [Microbacterium telephonicum]